MGKNLKSFMASFVQQFPVIGVGNIDQGMGALPQVYSIEVGHPEFSDHIMDMATGGHHTGALFQERHNAGCPRFSL